jgi:HEAT repeat protein
VKELENKVDDFDEKAIEEELKSTKSLIQTLLQTMKAYRLYEPNHPILSKFMDRLRKDFDRYFDEFDSLSFQIGEHRLIYRGKVVYESEDTKESLAFLFYKDGIREIRFYKGLDLDEIVNFLDIVRRSDAVNRLEDDLVTLLWEKDFPHITFTSVDDFLEGGSRAVPETEEDLARGLEYRGSSEEWFEEAADESEAEGAQVVAVESLSNVLNRSPGQSLVQACQLTPEEMEEIARVAREEQQPEYVYILINNLVEILLHLGEDFDAYENMISYFEQIITRLLENGLVGRAVTILQNLTDVMESMVLKDKQIFALRRIFEISSSGQAIALLGKAMKGNGAVDKESIHQYLQLLTKQAIVPLCQLLGELESGKWREAVCDILVKLCREEIQPLTKFLSNPSPFLICHILYVLRKIGHPSTLKYVGNLIAHQDTKVREETLQLLGRFGEKGKDLAEKFLRDPVPGIRAKASLILARMAKGQAVKPLMEIILSQDFYKRDYEEKVSFFRALGETGSEEAIPILKKIAKKRRWFQGGKWDEMRLCATNALKVMEGGPRQVAQR